MQSCLGIYIEKNLIKYAKVSKDRESLKIDSFGTKFFEKIETAIEQIIQETNSIKLPISINAPKAQYDYFNYFALLNKNALKKSIDIDFDMLCTERGIARENIENRYIFTLNPNDVEQMKAVNVSISKENIEAEKKEFEKYDLKCIIPMPIGITNLIKMDDKKNELIINLEEETTLTFCQRGQIDFVQIIDSSIIEALETISNVENSTSKAYEILKNTTISSQEYDLFKNDVYEDGNEYIDVIIPIVFKIINEVKEKINEYDKPIHKIYLSGTGITISNIDMYFQERLNDIPCEIIKPNFLNAQSLKIGIKDYLEVNSATALALTGLNMGIAAELNFAAKTIIKFSGMEITPQPVKVKPLKETSGEKFDAYEKLLVRIFAVFLIFLICYAIVTNKLYNNMDNKIIATQEKIEETNQSIDNMNDTMENISNLTKDYRKAIARMNNEAMFNTDSDFRSNEIQNFLSNLKTIIPRETKLVSLENTEGRHFVIQARANKFQQLGYLKALLDTPTQSGSVQKPILENVKASSGVKYHDDEEEEDYILITREGDLPE